jgi:hypothetical protein
VTSTLPPNRTVGLLEGNPASVPSLPLYRWMQDVSQSASSGVTPAQLAAALAALQAILQAEIDALQAEIDALDPDSLTVFGLLAVAELDGYGG